MANKENFFPEILNFDSIKSAANKHKPQFSKFWGENKQIKDINFNSLQCFCPFSVAIIACQRIGNL